MLCSGLAGHCIFSTQQQLLTPKSRKAHKQCNAQKTCISGTTRCSCTHAMRPHLLSFSLAMPQCSHAVSQSYPLLLRPNSLGRCQVHLTVLCSQHTRTLCTHSVNSVMCKVHITGEVMSASTHSCSWQRQMAAGVNSVNSAADRQSTNRTTQPCLLHQDSTTPHTM